MTTNRRVMLAGLALASVDLTGCGNAINTGPLGNGGTPGGDCVYDRGRGVVTDGTVEFYNHGQATAIIQKVSLTDPHHLVILAAWVLPVDGHSGYGMLLGYPPSPSWPTTFSGHSEDRLTERA